MKKNVLLLAFLLLISCREALKPRFPVQRTYRKDYSVSIYFNKKLFQAEQQIFDSIARADTTREWLRSDSGIRYYFLRKNDTATYFPQEGDLVRMNYGIYYVEGDTIYPPEEIGTKTYRVDKEEYFAGLREAVKLMKAGEEAVFFIPSYLGYGLMGDADRIPGNTPLQLYLKIYNITPQNDTL